MLRINRSRPKGFMEHRLSFSFPARHLLRHLPVNGKCSSSSSVEEREESRELYCNRVAGSGEVEIGAPAPASAFTPFILTTSRIPDPSSCCCFVISSSLSPPLTLCRIPSDLLSSLTPGTRSSSFRCSRTVCQCVSRGCV